MRGAARCYAAFSTGGAPGGRIPEDLRGETTALH